MRKRQPVQQKSNVRAGGILFSFLLFLIFIPQAFAQAIIDYSSIHHPVVGREGMVVSQNYYASEIGAEILRKGGNAVDAAVAVGFGLAVTLPRAGNLGGGGFMIVHLVDQNKTIAIDYREMAPAAAHRDFFLDKEGNVDQEQTRYSLKSAGVPGTVAGLHHALEKYGTMSWADVIEPAEKLARKGFKVSFDMAENLASRARLRNNDETCRVYFKPGCVPYEAGETMVLGDLAKSLKRLRKNGPAEFYMGKTARLLVAEMERAGGSITLEDLKAYDVKEREPVRGNFREYEVVSMPPPSSGGVHIIQMLNMLDKLPVAKDGAGSALSVHYLTEILKRAYADRSKYLGDPDFTDVPVKGLTDPAYAAELVKQIRACCVTPSMEILPGDPLPYESPDTTHFSVMDKWGNAVVNTYTLNFSYGAGITIPGTGILMNNEMDDFSAKPGVPNGFGLIGGDANAIEAGKRPLSSMTPTMVMKDGKPYLLTGSPGGSKIISSVFQILVNVLVFDMNLAEATASPRIHHQWLPDVLLIEPGFSPDTLTILKSMGYETEQGSTMGSVQSIMHRDGVFLGVADSRRPGARAVAP
ncbi:gamma-glutamyltransferase [Emcibacter sp.]|uniref:gamma-glutamyltransferase n=1 Tax=Emcibacter sp. TaxID=1979954 RepID=UPI002AA60324|nr:gamma-glutamyltransferase [Emcibacter sp.]